MKKGITAIIFTLNSEKDISEVLESIVQNSLKPDQIIITDGGSTDLTVKLASKWTNYIVVSERGFINQFQNAMHLIEYKDLLVMECDHRYPVNFLKDLIEERNRDEYVGIQGSLKCSELSNYWEKGYAYFYSILQKNKGIKTIVSGPALWRTKEYIDSFNAIHKDVGFGIDTTMGEEHQRRNYKIGLGHTYAYQKQSLNYQMLKKKIFSYGVGDYFFYKKYKQSWSRRRKIQSISHVFRQYGVRFVWMSIKDRKLQFIPFFLLIMYWRYYSWMKQNFK